jgi:hypothetical protein
LLDEVDDALAGHGRAEEAERLYEEAVGYTRKWGQVDAVDPALRRSLEKLNRFASDRGRLAEAEACNRSSATCNSRASSEFSSTRARKRE